MKERIAEFIREKAYKPMTLAELAMAMGIAEKQHVQLKRTLEQMEATGEVVQTRTERYGAPERMNLAVGTLQGHPKGFGFVVPDAPDAEDIFVGREALNGAWHGDRVVVRLSPPARMGERIEGEVIRILQRARQRVVGTFDASKHVGYVTPDEKRLPDDIFIPKGATNGAKSGEKVVVQVVRWPDARRNAEGKVVERLGMKGQVGVDILSVIRKFGLPEVFPPRVMKEVEPISDTVTTEAMAEDGRRDLTGWTIVTIDGEDAKDLDDAVNVERIGDGLWRLGVHIADVSYYVPEGSHLDREAYARATSVYLADRVVPMLPPQLSNGICSLNPHVERLTLSCVMEIDGTGKVQRYEIFPSVIRTAQRMTYTRVNQILAGDPAAVREYEPLQPLFREMESLMQVLRNKRETRGALDFDLPEAKVRLNEQGWPTEIKRVNRGIAERIIEEFMLVANETVAEHVTKKGAPFMFRVHGEPAPDRLAALTQFLSLFGYGMKIPQGAVAPKLLQGAIHWADGRPEENLVNSVLLRTMRQAVYHEENLGHFGLAADYYCHFTSPIRRYPDLVVHRVLRALLSGGVNARQRHKWEKWMPEAARHCSEQERVAMEAERETIDLKKAEYMSEKVGETFEGIISGVSQFGFFVQLENTVEGLVHVSTLADDYYHFHEQYYALIGERTRRRFRLGDPVVVRLTRADADSRQLDFALEAELSPTVTVVQPATNTRARAVRKRSFAEEPTEAAIAVMPGEKAAAGGRGNRRRNNGRARAATTVEPPKPVAAEDKKSTTARQPRHKRGGAPAGRAAVSVEQPTVAAAPVETTRPAGRATRTATESARRTTRSRAVDMWGVPLPEGRTVRTTDEQDPGVVAPFALKPTPGGGRGRKAIVEAPFAPSPATSDESGSLPSIMDGATIPEARGTRGAGKVSNRAGRPAGRTTRPRRSSRPRVQTEPDTTQP